MGDREEGRTTATGLATAPVRAGASGARVVRLIFAGGTVWAALYLWHGRFLGRVPAELDQYEELRIGAHLARGHGFASPFDPSAAAPPTSWSPPVYPAIVGAAYRALGVDSPRALGALALLNAVCYGAVAAGLFRWGELIFGRRAGLVAAGLFLLHPMFLKWTTFAWDHYLALAGFVWLGVVAARVRRDRATMGRAALLGFGLGGLILTNVSYALAAAALLLVASGGRRRSIAACAGALVVVLLPWTVRNYVRFDKLFLVRDSASFEAWFGNRPQTTGWLNSRSFSEAHPGHDRAERARLLGMGERGYFHLCRDRFVRALESDPGGFVRRCLNRSAYLFLSDPTERSYQPFMPDRRWRGLVIDRVALNGAVAALGVAGAWAAWRLGFEAVWVLGVALLCGLPFVPVSVWDRQTLPLRAVLLLFAGFLLTATAHRLRRGAWPTPGG